MTSRRFVTLSAICAASFTVVSALWADDSRFPEGPAKAKFLKICGSCHDVDIIADLRNTRQEWKDLVYNMKDKGAEATDQECDLIVDYLYKSFPKADEKK